MTLEKELDDFWIWFGMTPNEYAKSSTNGESETDYSAWNKIYMAAKVTIEQLNNKYDEELAELLIQSLAIDNECENILELIKEHLIHITPFSNQVIVSKQFHARWQLAELLGHKNKNESLSILILLFHKDKDMYVQRRALLSLRNLDLKKAIVECDQFINSPDPILKRIALEIKN